MAIPQVQTLIFVAGVADAVSLAQQPVAAGELLLNGGLVVGGKAVFDAARRVALASTGNDSALVFTITGTARPSAGASLGPVISETITIANGQIAISQLDYATVTAVSVNGATAGNITVGTSNATTIGSGEWMPLNNHISPMQTEFWLTVAAANPDTVTLEFTPDDPNVMTPPGGTAQVIGSGRPPATVPYPGSGTSEPFSFNPPQPWADVTIAAKNAATRSIYAGTAMYWRMTINAGATAATMQAIQAGIRN